MNQKIDSGGGWYSRNAESISIGKTDVPWLYTSGGRGLSRLEIPLLGKEDPKSLYTVKLHFAAIESDLPGALDVRLQGKAVAKGLDIAAEAGLQQAVVKEFTDITVDQKLLLEIVSHQDDKLATLSAVEVIRQE